MSCRRTGLTLIEVLTGIAVIVILVLMVLGGMAYAARAGRDRATRTTLQNAQAMVTELETTGGTDSLTVASGAIDAPGDVTGMVAARTGPAVQSTRTAMARLMAVPANAKAVGQIPQAQLFTFSGSATPVLLDAWNNPILYVGAPVSLPVSPTNTDFDNAYGLRGVTRGDQMVRITSTRGAYTYSNAVEQAALKASLKGFRPFFVSAGADGDFSKGDDNIYSFEN